MAEFKSKLPKPRRDIYNTKLKGKSIKQGGKDPGTIYDVFEEIYGKTNQKKRK